MRMEVIPGSVVEAHANFVEYFNEVLAMELGAGFNRAMELFKRFIMEVEPVYILREPAMFVQMCQDGGLELVTPQTTFIFCKNINPCINLAKVGTCYCESHEEAAEGHHGEPTSAPVPEG